MNLHHLALAIILSACTLSVSVEPGGGGHGGRVDTADDTGIPPVDTSAPGYDDSAPIELEP